MTRETPGSGLAISSGPEVSISPKNRKSKADLSILYSRWPRLNGGPVRRIERIETLCMADPDDMLTMEFSPLGRKDESFMGMSLTISARNYYYWFWPKFDCELTEERFDEIDRDAKKHLQRWVTGLIIDFPDPPFQETQSKLLVRKARASSRTIVDAAGQDILTLVYEKERGAFSYILHGQTHIMISAGKFEPLIASMRESLLSEVTVI